MISIGFVVGTVCVCLVDSHTVHLGSGQDHHQCQVHHEDHHRRLDQQGYQGLIFILWSSTL